MPKAFKTGDTVQTTINGETKVLTYRDAQTLVIEPNEAKRIESIHLGEHVDGVSSTMFWYSP